MLGELPLDLVGEGVSVVLDLDLLASLLVLFGVRRCLSHHLVDVVLGETRRRGDGNGLLLAGGAVLGRHVQDPVGVDVECDLDLGHAAGRRRDPHQMELAQRTIVPRHRPLTLEDVNLDRCLVVRGRREHFRLLGWDRAVPLDEASHDAA